MVTRLHAVLRDPRRVAGAGLAGGAALIAVLVLAPLPVVLGASRLLVLAVLVTGAGVTLGRAGFVDLSTGATAGAGAYAGGVAAALADLPAALGLVGGAVAGALVGAAVGAVGGRVGRTAGALTSLAVAAAVVTLLRAWPSAGGAAGFHAVPLLTGGDRTDTGAVLALLVVALLVAWRFARSRYAAAAAVAAHAPQVGAALGRRPALDAALTGAVAGAVLGAGGAAGAALSGSVAPAAYGRTLTAALALAVLVGGAAPLGPVVGTLFVWGPSVLWPTVPVLGDGPPLLVMGVLGIATLAWRRGRPLVPAPARPSVVGADGGDAPARPPAPAHDPATLTVTEALLPDGHTLDLEVAPGEVVALVGPNGAGKSTVLARVAGQLPDHGTVRIGTRPAPAGAVARARAGVARTWQRDPALPFHDARQVAARTDDAAAGAAWAAAALGGEATHPAGWQLVLLAARRPAIALLDEPAVDLAALHRFVRGLADVGTAVLLVEHRDVTAIADRTIRVHRPGDPTPAPTTTAPGRGTS